jgi:DNA-directed RNA polymerase specialized sigma24 family protein
VDELAETAFRRHYGQVYSFVRRRSANQADAEDIAAEVFADAAEALDRFRPGASPVLAWL